MYEKGHKTYLFRVAAASILLLGAGPGGRQMPGMGGHRNPVVVQAQFLSFGLRTPVFPEHANTVSHVYFNGTALVETKSATVTWTHNGTVPQVNGEGPIYPDGFSGAGQKGAGPFSADNNYSNGTDSFMSFGTSPVTIEYFFKVSTPVPDGTSQCFGGRFEGASTKGLVGFLQSGLFKCDAVGASSSLAATGPAIYAGEAAVGACVLSWSGATATLTAYKNGVAGTPQTGDIGSISPGNDINAHVGKIDSGCPYLGTLYEFHTIAGAALDASTVASRAAVLLTGPVKGGTLTHSRTTTAIIESPTGTLATFAPNVPRVNAFGLLVEPTRTNIALQSEALHGGPWAVLGVASRTADQAEFMGRGVVADRIVTNAIGDDAIAAVYQNISISNGVWYAWSFYAKSTSGTPTIYAVLDVVPSTAKTCVPCVLNSSTWTRCGGAFLSDGVDGFFFAGFDTRTGVGCPDSADAVTFDVVGAQLEVADNHAVSSYIPTGATSVQRTADLVNLGAAKMPLTAKWCAHVEFATLSGQVLDTLLNNQWFSAGTASAANSLFLREVSGGGLQGLVYDSAVATREMTHSFGAASAASVSASVCRDTDVLSEIYLPAGGAPAAASGAGTASWSSAPTPIYLMNSSAGTAGTSGYLTKFKVCKNIGNPDRCK